MAKTKTSTKATKSTKMTTTKKSTTKKVKEVTTEPVVTEPEPVVVEETKEEEVDLDLEWKTLFTQMETSQKTTLTELRQQMKWRAELSKMLTRRVKTLMKKKNKRGGGNQRKNPSGFNKPTDISTELNTFLTNEITEKLLNEYERILKTNPTKNKKQLTKFKDFDLSKVQEKLSGNGQFARTEVTSMIHMYIKAKNLQNKDDGRKFTLTKDSKLKKLLGVSEASYFNLQSHLSRHFTLSK
jgi:chromatin remodeling complex protein RSC6